jgi:hypothetical protein
LDQNRLSRRGMVKWKALAPIVQDHLLEETLTFT